MSKCVVVIYADTNVTVHVMLVKSIEILGHTYIITLCLYSTTCIWISASSFFHNLFCCRFKVWSRAKRDLGNSLVTANEQDSDIHVGLQQGESAKTASTQLR